MVSYFFEDTDFKFSGRRSNSSWLKDVAEKENRILGQINIIFCSDPYILDINRKYLGHDYYTDIITFDYCEDNTLSGDLFVSIDTVRANSEFYKTVFFDELCRVMVHGILHLIGYDDHTEEEKKIMRYKENYYLEFRKSL